MNFEPFDRLPLLEWAGWWDKTIDRWRSEGLPAHLVDRYEICKHFGLDVYRQDWLPVCTASCPRPTAHGSGIIASASDYARILPDLYPVEPVNRDRWQAWAEEQHRGDVVLWFTVDGFFWFARRLLGIEGHFYAFYDQPQLIHRINTDLANWILLVTEQLCSICTPDFMTFAEDMSYNNGPMLSEELFDEFMRPYYDRVVPALRKHGVTTIVDSDGDLGIAAQWFAEAGLDGLLPLERQAGTDIASLRARHPRMRFIGHFDKMTMDRGREPMRSEFERLLPTAAEGGFLVSCDHQTPPGVSYEQYWVYLSLFREYAETAGRMSQETAEPSFRGENPRRP